MEERILKALEKTEIIKKPKKLLLPDRETTIHYYLVTEPVYTELWGKGKETVLREGKVIFQKPQIVTTSYLDKIDGSFSFENKEESEIEILIREEKPAQPIVFYSCNLNFEKAKIEVFSEPISNVIFRLKKILTKDPWSCLIKGVDELWDVSLVKFVQEIVFISHYFYILPRFKEAGFLEIDQMGIPWGARVEIERLFSLVQRNKIDPSVLYQELKRWNLFREYRERFFDLFKK